MAPEISQVAQQQDVVIQDVNRKNWEVELANQAATRLIERAPHKSAQEIVEDLLARLKKKREGRESKGINHWETYCPQYLERLVAKHRVGDPRREIVGFILAKHDCAVELARRITRDVYLAEEAVSQTYIELLKGRTTVLLFYRALKMNARDLLEKRATELRRLESLDGLVLAAKAEKLLSSDQPISDCPEDADFRSSRPEDQDPLDSLIARQEQMEFCDELEYAISAVRYPGNRETLKRKWWKNSAIGQLEKRKHGRFSGGIPNRK